MPVYVLALPALMRKRAAIRRTQKAGDREMLELLRRYRLSFKELLDA